MYIIPRYSLLPTVPDQTPSRRHDLVNRHLRLTYIFKISTLALSKSLWPIMDFEFLSSSVRVAAWTVNFAYVPGRSPLGEEAWVDDKNALDHLCKICQSPCHP